MKGCDILIGAMRTLALDYLIQRLDEEQEINDTEKWYRNLRKHGLAKMFPFLVEDSGKIDKVYIIEPESKDRAKLTVQDIEYNSEPNIVNKLPFMRPSGPQSAQVGPIIKRSYNNASGAGPSEKILNTTIGAFIKIANSDKPWSTYFKDILNVLNCSKIQLLDGKVIEWHNEGYSNMLSCVVEKIGPQNNTVFLTVKDFCGKFPGENKQYLDYLMIDKLAGERYVTGDAPAKTNQSCPLCGADNLTVYPNALKGAGINLINADRAGVFPGINTLQAWKKYALCGPCADILYVFKFHVLKKTGPNKDRQPFGAKIAGDAALVIPLFFPGVDQIARQELLSEVEHYIGNIRTYVGEDEDNLLDILKDNKSIMNFIFLWANLGQNIDNITGMITNVLPSRLRELSKLNSGSNRWAHPLFPRFRVQEKQFDFKPDLQMKALRFLFFRPGGKKAKDLNTSSKLAQLKRQIAASVYQLKPIPEDRFWNEVMVTARCYWLEAIKKGDNYSLLNEGEGKKGLFLTAAGWLRNLNWWLYYFKKIGVMQMEKNLFEPHMEALKPYFRSESGMDNDAKAYAFLLGVLYGKVLQVQGAKGVNVGANALTWLKRLTLKGNDLPSLYIKTREKLLSYGTESSEDVRDLITEIGLLGIKLGDEINLDETKTNYYLLLGQSMTKTILPKK